MADRPSLPESLSAQASPLPVFRAPPSIGGPEELHELRVRIPVELHRQLLSLKVLRGKSLAETVALALDIYFAEKANAERAAAQEPTES